MSEQTTGDATMVTAVFDNPGAVERAYEAATRRGYAMGDINVVMADDTRRRAFAGKENLPPELASKSAEGGELGGGPAGQHMGLAISVVAAVAAALAIPGLGLVAAGPLAVALAGAGAAGVAATLVGALADWGLPEERVRHYDQAIRDGAVLVGVKARTREDARALAEQWRALGARDVYA